MTARFPFLPVLLALSLVACGDAASRESTTDSPAATAADSLAGDSTAWVARPARVGVIHTGMTRPALMNVLGQPRRFGYDSQERCTYVSGSDLPEGVQVMVFDSVVVRVDVLEPGVPTAEGIQVGDTEAAVLARYGERAVVTPHKYSGPEWHYVTVTPANDAQHRIVFETDGKVVKSYRIGALPAVEWVEGCS